MQIDGVVSAEKSELDEGYSLPLHGAPNALAEHLCKQRTDHTSVRLPYRRSALARRLPLTLHVVPEPLAATLS